ERILGKDEVGSSNLPSSSNKKALALCKCFFVELSVPLTRNVKLASQVKCPADVKRLRTLKAEHLTSLCGVAAILHGGRGTPLRLPNRANFTLQPYNYMAYYTRKRGVYMSESKLRTQSLDFAVSIIKLVKSLKAKHETIISNQIGRSGTSIGANIREAQYAHGTADFVAKLQIALKEANETGYWLELLYKTDYISEQEYKELDSACTSIRVMLISSVNTVKNKA
ncbi:MAG: four helix bundle protein, partial [Eubacteriales bacterium]|nr:four helix bundle protein [Eubacteriales bacterium]